MAAGGGRSDDGGAASGESLAERAGAPGAPVALTAELRTEGGAFYRLPSPAA
jgi:hypothetical protein